MFTQKTKIQLGRYDDFEKQFKNIEIILRKIIILK